MIVRQKVAESYLVLALQKSEFLKEFEALLAASTQAIYRKSGINGKMLRATFAAWLLQKTDLIDQ